MKVLRINENGSYVDGERISELTIKDVPWDSSQWTFRISSDDISRGRGGLTLYGKGFGNYDQDIVIRSYYE